MHSAPPASRPTISAEKLGSSTDFADSETGYMNALLRQGLRVDDDSSNPDRTAGATPPCITNAAHP